MGKREGLGMSKQVLVAITALSVACGGRSSMMGASGESTSDSSGAPNPGGPNMGGATGKKSAQPRGGSSTTAKSSKPFQDGAGGTSNRGGSSTKGGAGVEGGTRAIGGTRAAGGSQLGTNPPCRPSRTLMLGAAGARSASVAGAWNVRALAGTAGSAGVANAGLGGASNSDDWYVDARRGADDNPGTEAQPLKTISCAALSAGDGATVRLLDGIWDGSVDAELANRSISCGEASRIAFRPNVKLRAKNPLAVRIVDSACNGIGFSGGLIEGIRFECASDTPALHSSSGVLEIVGSSLRNCSVYGLVVAGSSQVTLRPRGNSDLTESPNYAFAAVRDQGHLIVEGGSVSYRDIAFSVQDEGTLELHGVTLQPHSAGEVTKTAILLERGATPHLVIDKGSRIASALSGIRSYETSSTISVDDLTMSNVSWGLHLTENAPNAKAHININRLSLVEGQPIAGLVVFGKYDLSLTNSRFSQCNYVAALLGGSGTATLDTVSMEKGLSGIWVNGDEDGTGLAIKARNVQIVGMQERGVGIDVATGTSIDFGTASSPGGNVIRGNSVAGETGTANLSFNLPQGTVAFAVGNIWDSNQQGADANGQYTVSAGAAPLDVSQGCGVNYCASDTNKGVLRLAE